MQSAANVLTQIGSVSTDILVLAVLFIVLFFIILSKGNKMFVATVLSFYPAIALYTFFPYFDQITGGSGDDPTAGFAVKLAVFAIFTVVSFLVIKYFVRRHINGEGGKKGLQAALLSLSVTSLILTVVAVIVPIEGIYSLSPLITSVLTENTLLWWLLGPLLVLFLIKS